MEAGKKAAAAAETGKKRKTMKRKELLKVSACKEKTECAIINTIHPVIKERLVPDAKKADGGQEILIWIYHSRK